MATFLDRFWAKVDKTGDCWIWAASRSPDGYGRIWLDGTHHSAHRVVWEIVVGPIPKGMDIDHLCFNPPCVNPAHLRPLDPIENRRGQRTSFKTHCKRGHEFTPDNTYIRPKRSREGVRQCRKCNAEAAMRYKRRQVLAA